MPLAKAARTLPIIQGCKTPHPNTLVRWARQGLRTKSGNRVHLRTVLVGGRNCTSIEELKRFIDALNDTTPSCAAPPVAPPPIASETRAELAKNILRHRGLIK